MVAYVYCGPATGADVEWDQEVSGSEAQDHAQCPVFQVGEASCGAGEQATVLGASVMMAELFIG